MTDFYATIAQVSFTIAGLMLVVLAGDSGSRNFWFTKHFRPIYAVNILFFLFFPGLISLASLIIQYPNASIPAWPLASIAFGGLYFFVSMIVFYQKRNYKEILAREENKIIEGTGWEICIFSIIFMIWGLISYLCYWFDINVTFCEIFMQIFLIGAIAYGIVNIILFLRYFVDMNTILVVEINNEEQEAKKDVDTITHGKENFAWLPFMILISAITFLVGIIISKEE